MNKHLPTYFDDFLAAIRPGDPEIAEYKEAHETLRNRLTADEALGTLIVNTFLQGSYRRATAICPEAGQRSDVDVVAVTRLSETEYASPKDAQAVFTPFLNTHYKGQWEPNGRSIGIELDGIAVDLVITSAPSEAQEGILKSDSVATDRSLEEASDWRLSPSWLPVEKRRSAPHGVLRASEEAQWKLEPLRIPDREAECWQDTHPLEQIRWTQEKNGACDGHYVNIVKALKWWRRLRHPRPKYPKGYPLEHLIGVCCPDGTASVAEGIVRTLEAIKHNYAWYAATQTKPILPDHGVPSHDVFKRITGEEFAAFYNQVCAAAGIARTAYDEEDDMVVKVQKWQELFGDAFPDPGSTGGDGGNDRGGFSRRTSPTVIGSGRFG